MKIEPHGDCFVIYKSGGKWRGDLAFCFFVDDDKASWSRKTWTARTFPSRPDAEECLTELKRRDRMRRKGGKL